MATETILSGYKVLRPTKKGMVSAVANGEAQVVYSSDWTYAKHGPLFVFRSMPHADHFASFVREDCWIVAVSYVPIYPRMSVALSNCPDNKHAISQFWEHRQTTGFVSRLPQGTHFAAAVSLCMSMRSHVNEPDPERIKEIREKYEVNE